MDSRTTGERGFPPVGSTGYRVRVRARTDDSQKAARFDGWGWFERATDDDVRDLHRQNYQGDAADALAHFAHEEEKNGGLAQLFGYLTRWNPRTRSGDIVGFEVVVNPGDVYAYLAARRPHLAAELFPGGKPDHREC